MCVCVQFGSMLDENAGSKFDNIGMNAMSNTDRAGEAPERTTASYSYTAFFFYFFFTTLLIKFQNTISSLTVEQWNNLNNSVHNKEK